MSKLHTVDFVLYMPEEVNCELVNIIGYLFGIRWITTYNFYTITKDIQLLF